MSHNDNIPERSARRHRPALWAIGTAIGLALVVVYSLFQYRALGLVPIVDARGDYARLEGEGGTTLSIGATLTVAPNQPAGTYSGSFPLTVNFQ